MWGPFSGSPGSGYVVAAVFFGILAIVLLCLVGCAARPGSDDQDTPNTVKAALWVVLPIVMYALVTAFVLYSPDTDPAAGGAVGGDKERVQLWAVISVAFAVLATWMLLRRRSRHVTADVSLAQVMSTKTSAASTVLLLWTFVVVYGIALIAGWHLVNNTSDFVCRPAIEEVKNKEEEVTTEKDDGVLKYCFQQDSWYQYLLLLGVPGAAAALSKQRQTDPDDRQSAVPPPPPPDTSAENTDAVAEVQYFIFNAIAMVFVLTSLVTGDGKLPEIPSVLLALTGASALVYTVEKRVSPT